MPSKRKVASKREVTENDNEESESEEEYEVEKVVGKRYKGPRVQYRIRWKGYDSRSDTWEFESNVSHSKELINEFLDAEKNKVKAYENEDFEVSRILEVKFHQNGKRSFMVRWKGYSKDDDSWEPEENLNCPDLIESFMQKVDQLQDVDERELRVMPKVSKRFAYNDPKVRSSKRSRGSRMTYTDMA